MTKPFIVGITGGSASGKTLFLEHLLRSFSPEELCLISQDNYYKPKHLQPVDEQGIANFDTPHSIDFEQYAQDIRIIQGGGTVIREEYTFNNATKKPKMLTFAPAPVVVVEGIFVLYYPELAALLDLKIFIDAKDHIKLKRRIIRDKVERSPSKTRRISSSQTTSTLTGPWTYSAPTCVQNRLARHKKNFST